MSRKNKEWNIEGCAEHDLGILRRWENTAVKNWTNYLSILEGRNEGNSERTRAKNQFNVSEPFYEMP